MSTKQKIIYASSSSVYGLVGSNIVDETYTSFQPHNHYDVTKYMIDLLVQRHNIEYYGLRFGTVNGYSPNVRNDIMINSMTYSAMVEGHIKLYIKDIIRPILGIKDLSLAIKTIIDNENDYRGIYNLASFSDTAENIARDVSYVTGKPIKEYDVDPTNIINSKLQTKCYDFNIDCSKFIKKYNFTFKDTSKSITQDLIDNFTKIKFSNRNTQINYE
jgi:nucleoside-diphosphate-sugar epimerase